MKTETTIRRAREAVGLILDGAIRHLESDYGPDEPTDRSPMIRQLFKAVLAELNDWDVLSRDLGAVEFLAGLRPHTLRTIRNELTDRDDDYCFDLIDEITSILVDLDGDEKDDDEK
jgi:hypothetical protein